MPYAIQDLGTFGLGNPMQIASTFKQNGSPGDPDAVYLEITDPAGTTTTYTYPSTGTWAHVGGTGVYTFTITPTIPGVWTGRFYATGWGSSSQDLTFAVTVSRNYP
jgi:hypothetical protein